MRREFVFSLGLVLGLVACKSADDTADTGDTSGMEIITLENEGFACLSDDGTDDISTGLISVVLDDCLTGCATDMSASCEASVVGDSVEVTAVGEYSVPTGADTCDDVCLSLMANCSVSGISEDTTSLSYAGISVDIDFPTEDFTCTDGEMHRGF
tara:strand:+ start:120 stop:584 length:465 start_codon:yes stop_codon:yes gene_type:complete